MSDPRELTRAEVQDEFLHYLRHMVRYWVRQPESAGEGKSANWRHEGLVGSILIALDGKSPLPAFTVTPTPHEDDKADRIENEDNWFPDDCDIAGDLYEKWENLT